MIDEDLINLDDGLRRLNIEYHIFFSGNRKKPPDDLRLRVEKIVKKLSECTDMSYSQRFRYTTLISRFYVHRDRWRRMLNDREMGVEQKRETTPPKIDTPLHSAGRYKEAVRICISDPKAEEEKVRALYDALIRIRGTHAKDTPPPYQQFANYIAKRTRGIQEKYECSKVAFTIALEEEAIRFIAAADKC
jgi:hypothetical protein